MKRRLTGAVLIALFTMLVAGAVPALAFDRAANEATMLQAGQSRPGQPGAARGRGRRAARPGGARALPGHDRSRLLRSFIARRRHGGRQGAQRGLLDERLFAVVGRRGDRLGYVRARHAAGRLQGLDALEFPPAGHPGQALARRRHRVLPRVLQGQVGRGACTRSTSGGACSSRRAAGRSSGLRASGPDPLTIRPCRG